MTYILKLYYPAADMPNNQVMITLLSLNTFKYNSLAQWRIFTCFTSDVYKERTLPFSQKAYLYFSS